MSGTAESLTTTQGPVKGAFSNLRHIAVFLLVFFCGFANLGTEIIGPRLLSSLFGNTTTIWAIIISVTLVGMALGYFIGGHIPARRVEHALSLLLVLNALWLAAASWLVLKIPLLLIQKNPILAIVLAALGAFLVPSLCFGTVSPLAVSLLAPRAEEAARLVGNLYALGTVGSVCGALLAAFYFIPWVGLALTLRFFALVLGLFALGFAPRWFLRSISLAALLLCALVPQPIYLLDSPLNLLEQVESHYQTIRVFGDGETFVRIQMSDLYVMADMDLKTQEPRLEYARKMLALAGDVEDKHILVIGGAGHTQARVLEKRGARVTEVEIDPVMVELSDRYFGSIDSEVVIQDGRAFLEICSPASYDLIFVDAFNVVSVPPQLTTAGFFKAAARALKPGGRMIYNFIGVPMGPDSDAFHALSRTFYAGFSNVRASVINGYDPVNIIFLAADAPLDDSGFEIAPRYGVELTDERNPIELFVERVLR